jgi:formate hydrogenlyase transcriptional activator
MSSGNDPRDSLDALGPVFEAAPYGVLVAREGGTVVFANEIANATFAFEPGELIGQPLSRVLPAIEDTYVEQGNAVCNGTRKDGTIVPVEIGLNVFEAGPSRYIIVSLADVTERRDREARLAAAANDYLAFHRLVAEIAARFGAVAPAALDETIVNSLRQIGETLRLDRAILWRRSADAPAATATHFWSSESAAPPEAQMLASIPQVISTIRAGRVMTFTRADNSTDSVSPDIFWAREARSGVVIPLAVSESDELAALAFCSTARRVEWTPDIVERLRLVAGVISQAMSRTRSQLELQKALEEIKVLRDRVNAENVELRREVRVLRTPGVVVADSAAMKRVLAQVEQVAPTPATVLLLGETGAGKEVMAQAIHDLSPRHQRQMVRVSCAAIPTALIESELFGRERGAYTGALSRQIGRFEAANQSTLFLDEIGDLPAEVQVKLLRVLQERVIERLGSTQSIKVDVRIIAATNHNLEQAVNDKTFREDLFYRLNVFPIVVPPLRERVEDIPGLVWSFVDEFSKTFRKSIESVSRESMRDLQRYAWPGNVRELRNVIERAVILSTGPQLVVAAPRPQTRVPPTAMTLNALEIEHIRSVLESTNWRVRGLGGAAERLGLKPTTLESRMARLGIVRKRVP